ncbi:ABC transporter ATP-binding protein [Paenarthrobacter sp. Z7-10]|nr:ABC transporter ATP-binding protein [Paenarthrobacter sp. Z7-10]
MLGLTLPPYLLSLAIDQGLGSGRAGSLLVWAALLLAMGIVNAFLAIMRHRIMSKVRIDASLRTVDAVTRHAVRLGAELPRRASAGEVLTIGIGDVGAISRSLTITGPGVGAVVAYIVIAVLLFSLSGTLALVVLLGVPALALILGPLLGRLQRAGTSYRGLQGELTGRMVDIVAGLRVLNGLGGKDVYAQKYRRQSQTLQSEGYRLGAVTSVMAATAVGLPALFLAVVVWLSARMAAEGMLSIGQLVAVYGYVAVLALPVAFFVEGSLDLSQALVAARRVVAILALEPEADDGGNGEWAPQTSAVLIDEITGVVVEPGLLSALVSAEGADVLALVDRLGGFTESVATWGGLRISTIDPAEFRSRVVVADNEAAIFSGSVREVIAGAQDRPEHVVLEALRVASAADIVQALPDGLDSVIDTGARNLSGGERQRIRLARALAAGPEVLLAVDPMSAVDASTEAGMAARLRAHRAGRTTLVSTTSPLLLDSADRVHFLVNGRVRATGTHAELFHTDAAYRALMRRNDEGAPTASAAERGSS